MKRKFTLKPTKEIFVDRMSAKIFSTIRQINLSMFETFKIFTLNYFLFDNILRMIKSFLCDYNRKLKNAVSLKQTADFLIQCIAWALLWILKKIIFIYFLFLCSLLFNLFKFIYTELCKNKNHPILLVRVAMYPVKFYT